MNKKFYPIMSQLKTFILMMAGLMYFSAQDALAIKVYIGANNTSNSSTSYPTPFGDWYTSQKSQYLYTAAELAAQGISPGAIITEVGWIVASNFTVSSTPVHFENYKISLKTTTTSSLPVGVPYGTTGTFETGLTTFYGPTNYTLGAANATITAGDKMFVGATPFIYTGGNLLIEICGGTSNGNYAYHPSVQTTTGLSFNGSLGSIADGIDGCGQTNTTTGYVSNDQTTRPRLVLDFIPGTPCTGTPTGGTATASATSICPTEEVILSLTGSTLAGAMNFQWESSPNNTTYTAMGAPGLSFSTTVNPTASAWYRVKVICTASNQSVYSAPVQVTVAPFFPGGTYTINRNQPTGGTNFQTFSDAINAVKCGINGPIVFNVVAGSGPYTEQVIVPHILNTNTTNTVTFNGNGNQFNISASGYPGGINVDGGDYVTFNDFRVFVGSGSYRYGAWVGNNSNYVKFKNCYIAVDSNTTSSSYNAFVVSGSKTSYSTGTTGSSNITVEDCNIVGGYFGATVYGVSSNKMEDVTFRNTKFRDYYYYGIYNYYLRRFTVENCELTRPNRTSFSAGYHIYSNYTVTNKITGNKIHNLYDKAAATNTNSVYGIYLYLYDAIAPASEPNIVANNAIYNINANGAFYGIYVYACGNTKILYNTVSSAHTTTSPSSSTVYGIYIYGYSNNTYYNGDGLEIRNNIVDISRPHTNNIWGIYYSGTLANLWDSDHNNVFVGNNKTNGYFGYAGSANRLTRADWTAATGKDANSNTLDPMFVDPANHEMQFGNFAMDNLGEPTTFINEDINGETRHATTPDIGAYETNPCKKPTNLSTDSLQTDAAIVYWRKAATSMGSNYVLSQSATFPTGAGTNTQIDSVVLTNLTPNTTYYFYVRNSCGGNFYSDWVRHTFTTPPCTFTKADIATTSPDAICEGEVAMLSAPLYLNATYTWYHNGSPINGAISNSYGAYQTGTYFVSVSKGGCEAKSDTLSFTMAPAPTYNVTATALQACAGQPITLKVQNPGAPYSYQWRKDGINIPGATSDVLSTSSSGKYVVLVGTGSCVSMSKEFELSIHPSPYAPIYDTARPILMTTPGYTTYSWIRDGVSIPNSNGSTYIANINGVYKVQVVDRNGCIGVSEETTVHNSSITSLENQDLINVYPNPAIDIINISAPKASRMSIVNIAGQAVYTGDVLSTYNVSHLANGQYNLMFFDKDGVLLQTLSLSKTK